MFVHLNFVRSNIVSCYFYLLLFWTQSPIAKDKAQLPLLSNIPLSPMQAQAFRPFPLRSLLQTPIPSPLAHTNHVLSHTPCPFPHFLPPKPIPSPLNLGWVEHSRCQEEGTSWLFKRGQKATNKGTSGRGAKALSILLFHLFTLTHSARPNWPHKPLSQPPRPCPRMVNTHTRLAW